MPKCLLLWFLLKGCITNIWILSCDSARVDILIIFFFFWWDDDGILLYIVLFNAYTKSIQCLLHTNCYFLSSNTIANFCHISSLNTHVTWIWDTAYLLLTIPQCNVSHSVCGYYYYEDRSEWESDFRLQPIELLYEMWVVEQIIFISFLPWTHLSSMFGVKHYHINHFLHEHDLPALLYTWKLADTDLLN